MGIATLLKQFPKTRNRDFFGENRELIRPEQGITGNVLGLALLERFHTGYLRRRPPHIDTGRNASRINADE